ncbi:MAG: hypothetical protein RLZZ115_3451, partial [Cyanobacteriota bacterium]
YCFGDSVSAHGRMAGVKRFRRRDRSGGIYTGSSIGVASVYLFLFMEKSVNTRVR